MPGISSAPVDGFKFGALSGSNSELKKVRIFIKFVQPVTIHILSTNLLVFMENFEYPFPTFSFRYDYEPLRNRRFSTCVAVSSSAGELTCLDIQFYSRGVLLVEFDCLKQRTLSLQLSALPPHIQDFFNLLSKEQYVEYRTGLLSAIRSKLAAQGVDFKGKK